MRGNSRTQLRAFLEAFDFGRFPVIADIGGGNGALLAGLLGAHGSMRGIVFDQPHVTSRAEETLRAAGVADRCEMIGGSFFESVPAGADAYVLKHVLHDWEDDECVSILNTVRASSGNATLLVLEQVVGPPNADAVSKFSDLNMLVMPGGRERTAEEWSGLLRRGGFKVTGVHPTSSAHSVIEAQPA